MTLFDFRAPNRVATSTIRFRDESGDYSLGELLDALWIQLTAPIPTPDWPSWYRMLGRLGSYVSTDAPFLTLQEVDGWPTCPIGAGVATLAFRDNLGCSTIAEFIDAIGTLALTKPVLARRLARTVTYLAARDRDRDRAAYRILERAGLLDEKADEKPPG
jgi:hypothetical protein